MLDQIQEICISTLNRPRNANRVIRVFKEANDKRIKSSLTNDLIIEKHFSSIKLWVEHWDKTDIKLDHVKEIYQQSVIYFSFVKDKYIQLIKDELSAIDLFSNKGFDTKVDTINRLLNQLVSQLVYDGYSIAFLQIAIRRLYRENPKDVINRLFQYFFHGEEPNKERQYACFISGKINPILCQALNADYIKTRKEQFFIENRPEDFEGYIFNAYGRDPYSAFRNGIIQAFRKLSLQDPRFEQESCKSVWEKAFYTNSGTRMYIKYNFHKNNDPAIVTYRKNTLMTSLKQSGKNLSFYVDELIKIEEPLHFYHLATTATSLENSYILLWTSLESLMGLRTNGPDISDVTENVKSAIPLGAVGRRVSSFGNRLNLAIKSITQYQKCMKYYSIPTCPVSTEEGLIEWLLWLTSNKNGHPDDPYNFLFVDPLLCKNYREINENWTRMDSLRKVVENSERSIENQIDRLYFLRNQITHSGRAGKIGDVLWIHLEWYVGKLLVQALEILKESEVRNPTEPKDLIWSEFRRRYIVSMQYMNNNREKSITEEGLIQSGIFKNIMFTF